MDLLRAIDVSRFTVMLIYGSRRADLSFKASLPTLSARGIGLLPLDFGRGVDPVADAVAFARIVRVVKRVKPDVLHLHGAKAGALGRIAAVLCKVRTTVYTPHGGAFHKFTGFGGAIYLAIERLLDRVCKTHYIGVSQDWSTKFELRYGHKSRVFTSFIMELMPQLLPQPVQASFQSRFGTTDSRYCSQRYSSKPKDTVSF